MITAPRREPGAYRRHVLQIVIFDIRQRDLVRGVHVEILARHLPGQMRAMKAAGQEKRLVLLIAQFTDRPIGILAVPHLGSGTSKGDQSK